MLCRNLSEDDVKALFNTYGAVDDVSILRNADGKSKGAVNPNLPSGNYPLIIRCCVCANE